jgi:hypothetical protein
MGVSSAGRADWAASDKTSRQTLEDDFMIRN